MQSKTSFFNRTVFRKNMTRFAPVYGAASLGLLLYLLIMFMGGNDEYGFDHMTDFTELIAVMGVLNCGYALLNAQLLFGDLYTARSCYALHAMPLRRETWYVTHVVSGLVLSLIPTAVMTLASVPVVMGSCVVNAWQIPLYFFLASNIQYICMFGIAMLCTFCAGNRLGMIAMYGFANLFAALVGLFAGNVCMPLYFGVVFDWRKIQPFSPVLNFLFTSPVALDRNSYWNALQEIDLGNASAPVSIGFTLNSQVWAYYGICAALGAVLLVVSLYLYKKRNLECAGDFLAFRHLAPIGTVLCALSMGMIFQTFFTYVTESDRPLYIFMAVGLVIGWFGVRMLLERTTRVFRRKSFLGLAALSVFVAVGMTMVHLDPFGLVEWIPDAQEVKSVTIDRYWMKSEPMESQKDIENVIRLHQLGLEQRLEGDWSGGYKAEVWTANERPSNARYGVDIEFTYTMQDDSVRTRHYVVYADSEAGRITAQFMSRPDIAMTGDPPRPLDPESFHYMSLRDFPISQEYTTPDQMASLLDAIRADCEAGNMAQLDELHTGYFTWEESNRFGEKQEQRSPELNLYLRGSKNDYHNAYFYIDIYTECENTLKWLSDRGLLEEAGVTVEKNAEYYNRYGGTWYTYYND